MHRSLTTATKHGSCRARWSLAAMLAIVAATFLVLGGATTQAETGQKALVLGSSVPGGISSAEAKDAIADGFTVTVVNDATWATMTAAQFADYQLVIVGDPQCGSLPQAVTQNAGPLADAVMARAGGNTKVGNRLLIGTDPNVHFGLPGTGGGELIRTGIAYAGSQDGATNLYLDFSCFDQDWDGDFHPDGLTKLLPKLTADPSANWTQNVTPPCGGAVSLIANAAQFSTLTTSALQGWNCSVHQSFPTFPADWSPMAIATDTATTPTCGTDVETGAARCGQAYVLVAGAGITATAPNLHLTPPTATSVVGITHTVTAKVTNPDGTPNAGAVVSFLISGANAGTGGTCVPASCATNAAGEVTFTYTGASIGDDTIHASVTIAGSLQSATAAKEWTVPVAATPPAAAVAAAAAPTAAQAAATSKPPVNPLLACSGRPLVLIDVLQGAGNVSLRGAADERLVGRSVSLVFTATHKQVATATVKPDGSFSAIAPLPPKGLRTTNLARYQAVLGKEVSNRLKLVRRVLVTTMTSAARRITIGGRVLLPLGKPIQDVTVEQRVSCRQTKVVKTFKPGPSGSFRVTIDAPQGASTAVYVLRTKVRKNKRNPKLFLTKSLPREVGIR